MCIFTEKEFQALEDRISKLEDARKITEDVCEDHDKQLKRLAVKVAAITGGSVADVMEE
jgi:hypothetical protein